jgi:hypothetical protein
LKQLIQESIAEDMEAWRATFEIIANKMLMRQIRGASKARHEGRESDFIPWEKIKREKVYWVPFNGLTRRFILKYLAYGRTL